MGRIIHPEYIKVVGWKIENFGAAIEKQEN